MIINQALEFVYPTILNLGWVDRYGGVAFPFTRDEGGVEVNDRYVPNNKTYMVGNTMTNERAVMGGYNNLIPDSRYTNLLYWEVVSEGRYVTNNRTPAKGFSVASRARLVFWLNFAKMGMTKEENAEGLNEGIIGANLADALTGDYDFMEGGLLQLSNPTFEQKDANRIFPADYGTAIEAYKLYPYGYGALTFDAAAHINPACMPPVITRVPIKCVTEW